MEKKEFLGLYDRLINNYDIHTIDRLYMFSCLTCSGFTDNQAYDLLDTLTDLWLKDENCRCISGLSDMLYEYCTNHGVDLTKKISTRKLLVELYRECDI